VTPKTSYARSHPQRLLDAPGLESHGIEKLFLSRNHLVAVFVRVPVKCRRDRPAHVRLIIPASGKLVFCPINNWHLVLLGI